MNSTNSKTPRRGRPPLAPDDSEARKRLIDLGLAYLTEKGFTAVGINEILRESAVPKGSFYHYFKSKTDFGIQLLEAYDQYFSNKLDRCFQNEELAPLQRIQAFVDDAEKGMTRFHFKRGCLVGNLSQEMGALPEDFRLRLQSTLSSWEKKTAVCIHLAQQRSEATNEFTAQELANYFWVGWEGAVLRAKLCQNAEPLQLFAKGFFFLVKI